MTTVVTLPDLATLRQQRGISLGQIAAKTKIGMRYLEGIEHGEYALLPGGIYNTSYIRQYARAIGFPEDDLLAAYQSCSPKLAVACYGGD
jgi:cytoskeletal protein RodZ